MERRAQAAAVTGFYLLVVAGVLVLANLLFATSGRKFRYDVTEGERFTLSKGSRRLVTEGLKQDLQVDVYVTRGLAKSDVFIQDLTDLLKEYESATSERDGQKYTSHFKFSIIEPKTQEEKDAAKKEGLQEQYLAEGSETTDAAQIKTGFMGFVFKYGAEKELIPFWPPNEVTGIEFFISNKIREVRDRADKIETKIGIITGKDELKITDNVIAPGNQPMNVKQIFDNYFPFYKFEDVDLQNGDAEINKDLAGIVITQPQKDYTEKELRRIDEFLMLGNKAAVFYVSAVNLKPNDASMKATLNLHGLDKLLSGYGVEMKREALFDMGTNPIPVPLANQQVGYVNMPSVLLLSDDGDDDEETRLIDKSHVVFFRMPQVAVPFPSPLVSHPEKQPEAKLKIILRSSPSTFTSAQDTLDMKDPNQWRSDAKGQQAEQKNLAIAVEGTLASAFAGGGDDMGIKVPAKSPSPSRVLVVSSSEFLANPFARAGNPPPMPPQLAMMGNMGGDENLQRIANGYLQPAFRPLLLSFKNALDWIGNDADLIAVNAKILGEPTLSYAKVDKPNISPDDSEDELKKKFSDYEDERKKQRSKVQSSVEWTLYLLPASLFALLGLIFWLIRTSSRKSISLA
jgi:hypothetical protein